MHCLTSQFQTAVLILLISFLAACTVSDVGEVSVRKAVTSVTATTDQEKSCRASAEAQLVNMAAPGASGSEIAGEEHYSIRLRRGYISRKGVSVENLFTDLSPSAEGLGETSVSLGQNAARGANLELLVVSRVFDYGKDTTGFRTGIEAQDDAKVIFASSDVYKGQQLSFENLPIIGPVDYSGGGLGVQLAVIEVDTETDTQRALVRGLVEASGIAANAAGSGLAGQALTTVVGSLLDNGNADDRLFEVSAGFDTALGSEFNFVRFETGLFAFIADYEREQSIINSDNLFIDPSTARIFVCPEDDKGKLSKDGVPLEPVPFEEGTYFVLQILKSPGNVSAQTTFEAVAEARASLQRSGFDATDTSQSIALLGNRVASIALRDQAMSILRKAEASRSNVATLIKQLDDEKNTQERANLTVKIAQEKNRASFYAYQLGGMLYKHRNLDGAAASKVKELDADDLTFLLERTYEAAARFTTPSPGDFTSSPVKQNLNTILEEIFKR
ncbi:MAG: hypothetical protein AAF292_17825 [Pseudomonadota bacterium]